MDTLEFIEMNLTSEENAQVSFDTRFSNARLNYNLNQKIEHWKVERGGTFKEKLLFEENKKNNIIPLPPVYEFGKVQKYTNVTWQNLFHNDKNWW